MNTAAKPFTGRKALILIVGFFAVVAAVNGVFIAAALTTFPGLTEDNPYQRGLAYNRVLDAAERQRMLGWRISLTTESAPQTILTVQVADAQGRPVEGLVASVALRRPAERDDDREAVLTPIGGGTYRAALSLLAPGNWDAELRFEQGAGEPFIARQRLWMKP